MRRILWLIAVVGCGGGDDGAVVDAPGGGDGSGLVDAAPIFRGDPLIDVGQVELIKGGFQFTEGPQWRDAEGDLVFSDIPANTIHRYLPRDGDANTGDVTELRMPSNMSNGLAIDAAGALLAAEHGSRSVTRGDTPLAERFETKRLNSPNDLVIARDGSIYFTDPPFGISDNQRELDFMGVFRIAPDGRLTAERRGALSERPNGIGLSPDGRTLYVADSGTGEVSQFAVAADGTLGPRAPFVDTAGGADGLTLDAAGNVFVTTTAGVEVYAPDGRRWGAIAVPMKPANCAFGGADRRTLYITAGSGLYRVRLAHPGLL